MRKEVLLILLTIAFAINVSAQMDEEATIPGSVENRLPVEFHSVTGDESVQIDLQKYFGRLTDFVASETQHVNVAIDPETGMATMSAKDSGWRGIEEVIFATSEEYLYKEEKEKRFISRYGNLSKINLSEDKIAMESDAFTQEQFSTIMGTLKGEQVDIVSFMSNHSLLFEINKELTMNFSFEPERSSPLPEIDFDFKFKKGNLTAAYYKEPNQLLRFSLVLFGIGAVIIGLIYMKYSWAGAFREAFLTKKKKEKVSKKDIYKNDLKKNLKKVRKMIGREKPSKLYRQVLHFTNSFLSKACRVRGTNLAAIETKLEKMGVSDAAKSRVKAYITEYRDKAYSPSKLTDENVHHLVSFVESMMRGL